MDLLAVAGKADRLGGVWRECCIGFDCGGQPGAIFQGGTPAGLVARDENTGQSYLKLPLPDADTMRKITDLLSVFTGGK